MTEKEAYLMFALTNGIGPGRAKILVDYFGSAEDVWKKDRGDWENMGLSGKLAGAMEETRRKVDPAEKLLALEKIGISVIALNEETYPALLQEIYDPPLVLFVKGNCKESLSELTKKAVGVVGTRKVTVYGKSVTEDFTSSLVSSGVTIISGLARGVDSIAHRTAIEFGGKTVAVLGSGVDVIYPPENLELYRKIISGNGYVISEFPPGILAMPGNFPARNRIVSGMSKGILITEAISDSGSLITASHAADQGRDVFVVPGPITSSSSKGANELIKKGARLVTDTNDILSELGWGHFNGSKTKVVGANPEEERILAILRTEPATIDELVKITGIKVNEITGLLTIMEISGKVTSLGGKWSIKR